MPVCPRLARCRAGSLCCHALCACMASGQRLTLTWGGRLAWQLQKDCQLLEELRVMDYSLLLGLHFRSPDYGSTPHADRVSFCPLGAVARQHHH